MNHDPHRRLALGLSTRPAHANRRRPLLLRLLAAIARNPDFKALI
jgi:hypothetical protein